MLCSSTHQGRCILKGWILVNSGSEGKGLFHGQMLISLTLLLYGDSHPDIKHSSLTRSTQPSSHVPHLVLDCWLTHPEPLKLGVLIMEMGNGSLCSEGGRPCYLLWSTVMSLKTHSIKDIIVFLLVGRTTNRTTGGFWVASKVFKIRLNYLKIKQKQSIW